MLLLLGAMGAISSGKQTWPDANALVLFIGAVAIEAAVIALPVLVVRAILRRVERSRRVRRRAHVAADRERLADMIDAATILAPAFTTSAVMTVALERQSTDPSADVPTADVPTAT